MNRYYKIKDLLIKFNGHYKIKNTEDIDNLIKNISNNININYNTLKEIVPKYCYIIKDNLVIDTNYKTYNNYETLCKIYNKIEYKPIRHNNNKNPLFEPYGVDWIHDEQKDDDVNSDELKRRTQQYEKLNSIIYPAQRSPEWYIQRDGKITASDAGVVIGENKYEQPYRMIVKKTRETFQNNEATYHGKKYEDIAKLIYEYRVNVQVKEFGMVEHPTVKCLGASPDGIVTPYKNDGIHLTSLVGRMLEIKVPLRRQICKTGEIKGVICPIYYWDQVQLQMECCDLDECDFWQCTLCEYPNRDIFINDTCKSEPFRSKTTSFEKGCLIQLLPIDKIVKRTDKNYLKTVHECANFIHPPKIEMTPEECDEWVSNTIKDMGKTHPNYVLDRVIYWYLKVSHNVTIKRDKQWFEDNKHKYEKMWEDITLIRSNQLYKDIFLGFVDSTSLGDKDYEIEPLRNKIIFNFIEKLYQNKDIINLMDEWNKNLSEIKNKNILTNKLEELNKQLDNIN
jgi:putative phage-type endonuclease